ncbi:hypothetical protein [Bailinhaonella thermotolerans]|nr:hypothetical protein [Bailinhaonella thermotolerans]
MRPLRFHSSIGPGPAIAPIGLTPDGKVLASLLDARGVGSAVALVDPGTGAATVLSRFQDGSGGALKTRQSYSGVADARHVAWLDSAAQGEAAGWRLMVHDRASGRTRVAARSGTPVAEAGDLSLADGRLRWSASRGGSRSAMVMRPGDSAPKVWRAKTGAAQPYGRDVVAVAGDRLVRFSAEGRRREVLAEYVTAFAAAGDVLAWCPGEGVIVRLGDGSRLELPEEPALTMSADGPLVAWQAETGGAVLDTRTRVLTRLPKATSFVLAAGGHLLWGVADRAGDPQPRSRTTYHLARIA